MKMCLQCFLGTGDTTVIVSLRQSVENPGFTKWTPLTIHQLALSYVGFNGLNASIYAKSLLDEYMEWIRIHPNVPACCPGRDVVAAVVSTQEAVLCKLREDGIQFAADIQEELRRRVCGCESDNYDVIMGRLMV